MKLARIRWLFAWSKWDFSIFNWFDWSDLDATQIEKSQSLILIFKKIIVKKQNKNAFLMHSNDNKWSIVIEFILNRKKLFDLFIIFEGKQIQKTWQKAYF